MQSASHAHDLGKARRHVTGLCRIVDDRIDEVDPIYDGPVTVLVPSEDVLVLAVDLPFASRRQREAAAPFAVEGLIAQPLDQVHVALGMEIAPSRHLCGVVRLDVMARWTALLDQADLDQVVLTPDALMLATPPTGAWRLVIDDGRALVRTDDGAGFAIDLQGLSAAWQIAGRPRLLPAGDPLPELMREGVDDSTFELSTSGKPLLVTPPLDLRQGAFTGRRARPASLARTLSLIAAAAVAAHLAILVADTVALDRSADREEAETRRLLAARAPGAESEPDLAAAVDRVAPEVSAATGGPFISTLSRVSGALPGTRTSFRAITYAPAQPLKLAVSAPDAAALDAAVRALNQTGLQATPRIDAVTGGAGAGLNAAVSVAQRGGQP
ncbi:type II secretion system protein GspL [Brevundimonas sp. PAMC22021]|uniref:type II secretion system protein GspL n=1 Tax=Brevundimonas sp. PAMC22021 TaxID=2861285 RepID=UPI001C626966|nr:type II secretion system protein GspL [Brevundimonas sp. PAMC22021]QYF85950.1 hypothetical protein KY493_08715 [Brevundimonas sp. PAMC22021]